AFENGAAGRGRERGVDGGPHPPPRPPPPQPPHKDDNAPQQQQSTSRGDHETPIPRPWTPPPPRRDGPETPPPPPQPPPQPPPPRDQPQRAPGRRAPRAPFHEEHLPPRRIVEAHHRGIVVPIGMIVRMHDERRARKQRAAVLVCQPAPMIRMHVREQHRVDL